MKLLSLFAAVCLFSSLLAAQTKVTSFHSTAESADVTVTINGTFLTLGVSRGDDSDFLSISSTVQNPDGTVTETSAFGNIPGADFTNSGLNRMRLNVDTSQVPGFSSTTCTFTVTPPFTSTCSPGPLGVVQADWINNRISSETVLFENHQTFLSFETIDSHVDSELSSADASGSFLGFSFSVADNASVGLNRDTTITITQVERN